MKKPLSEWRRYLRWLLCGTSINVLMVLLLFIAGITSGIKYMQANGIGASYQETFGPAVMLATGRGFVDPKTDDCPALRDFLSLKREHISPGDLPGDLPTAPPDTFQGKHRYLLTAVALSWRLFGVSWDGLTPLFGVLYGVSVAAAFGIFRLGMNRWLALTAGLLILMSPVHLAVLPVLRDYAKAPFMLMAFLVMGCMVRVPLSRRAILILSAVGGMVTGVGLGFRQDLFMSVPAFVVTILFLSATTSKAQAQTRAGALIAYATAFAIPAYPILISNVGGSNIFHIFLLGITNPFDSMLGVGGAPYSIGSFYADEWIAALANSYAFQTQGRTDLLSYGTPAYDQFTQACFLNYVRHFPADMITRAYAAALRVVDELPFCNLAAIHNEALERAPYGLTHPLLLSMYGVHHAVLSAFQGWGRYLAAASLVTMSARNVRAAVFCLLFVLYFAGHMALQFSLRHFFHLEFVSLWAVGFLLQQAISQGKALARPDERDRFKYAVIRPATWWSPPLRRAILFSATATACLLGVLYSVRGYQYYHVGRLAQQYLTAETQPVETEVLETDSGSALLRAKLEGRGGNADALAPVIRGDYLELELKGDSQDHVQLGVLYEAKQKVMNWSMRVSIPLAQEPFNEGVKGTRFFLPVFNVSPQFWASESRFAGFLVGPKEAPASIAVRRVSNPGQLPLMLQWNIPPDVADMKRYQTLTR